MYSQLASRPPPHQRSSLHPILYILLYSFSGGPIQIKISRFVRRCRRRRHGLAPPLGAGRAGSGSDSLEAFRQQLSQQAKCKGNNHLDNGIEGWSVGVQMLGYVYGREEDGPILQGRVGRVEEKEDAEARQDRGWGGHLRCVRRDCASIITQK